MHTKLPALLTVIVFATPCFAQAPGWTEPSSGLVFDPPTKSLRRITGFPGAAQLSKAVVGGLEWASIAPDAKRGLVRMSSGEFVWLEGLDLAEVSAIPVSSLDKSPSKARWKPDSSAVRLYSEECACFLTLGLEPSGQPGLIDKTIFADPSIGAVLDFSWSDSTTVISTAKGLFQTGKDLSTSQLFAAKDNLTYLLEPDGRAWGVRSSGGQIYEVRLELNQEAELRLVTADAERFTDVSAIALSAGTFWAADRKTKSLYQIALDGGALLSTIEMDSAPTRLTPLRGRRVWLIRDRIEVGEPLFILEGSATPQVFFVPGGNQQ